MPSRLDYIKGNAALISIGTSADSLLKGSLAFAGQNPQYVDTAKGGKTLILVQLAGGNDGLNTVVPVGDSSYRSARKVIGVADDQALPLEQGFGLHPKLTGLKGLWDAGKFAVIRGVGYPSQNYSHFKSMAIWQSADPDLKLQDGWLGRSLEKLEADNHDPFLGFNIGSSTPAEMRIDTVSVPSVQNPSDYNFKLLGRPTPASDPRTATLMKLYDQYPSSSPYGVLLETTANSAVSSAKLLADASGSYKAMVEYPKTPFAAGLAVLAEAVVADLGMRVGHISLGSFDTHAREVDDHSKLMETFDQGMTAFYKDLAAHGRADDVLVLTWSEFGRRVQENANGGTDHGSASIAFVMGNAVQKGLYGDQPSMSKLIDNGNLSFTTDFRSVYATVLDTWLGVPSEALLGKKWDTLGFVA